MGFDFGSKYIYITFVFWIINALNTNANVLRNQQVSFLRPGKGRKCSLFCVTLSKNTDFLVR